MPRVTISLLVDLVAALDSAAVDAGCSRSELVRVALAIYLAQPYTPTASEAKVISSCFEPDVTSVQRLASVTQFPSALLE